MIGFHGFLGAQDDFAGFPELAISAVDLWALTHFEFDRAGQILADKYNGSSDEAKADFLGYSMGGRLLLNMLAQGLKARSLIFVSTHTGLKSVAERQLRLTADTEWADRFASEDWHQLMTDWNNQGVLSGPAALRCEAEFDRTQLSNGLRNWSLARQPDFLPMLSEIGCPVLWICGQRDQKFSKIMQSLPENIETLEIDDCGHRVLLEKPKEFCEGVSRWLEKIN